MNSLLEGKLHLLLSLLLALQVRGLQPPQSNYTLTSAARRQLRESISGSLRRLQEREQVRQMLENDPLLG